MSNIDESSLLTIKAHINSHILAKNWSQKTSFCAWVGVICSHRHPRVIGLDLSNMDLRGTIAKEIGNLSFLTFLGMSNNSINGQIPSEIGNLRRLRVLDMSYNNLSGNIPTEFGNLPRIQELFLRNNQLTGELPSAIFNISSLLRVDVGRNQMNGSIHKDICGQPSKLEWLGLHFNQFEGEILSSLMRCHSLKILSLFRNKFTGNIPSGFWNLSVIQKVGLDHNLFTGTIPPSIGNLSNLEVFDIKVNSFEGTIPAEMGQLSSLTSLSLRTNKLNGEVPQSIFNISSLQILSLAYNNLSGNLPFSIDKGLPNIEQIFLGNNEGRYNLQANQFHGQIPNSISNLSKLTILDLSANSFTGLIPITLGNLHQLRFLNLAYNQLTNNLSKPEQDFLSSLANCKYLKSVNISSNPITGVLPESLGSGNLSASLETFKAFSCRILSPIPNEIGNLSSLLWLNLGYNHFRGAIPATLERLKNLQKLEINGNRFQGSISHVLCNLNNLCSVNLAVNNLSGQLPSCLGNLSLLREIYLSHNAFNSNIPSTLWFHEHVERMYLSNNFLSGSLSQEIGKMKSLIELDLSRNQLHGEISSNISQLQNAIHLSLSNNKFSGPIIKSFADMKGLQYLDLSHNILSGPIPKSLEALLYLHYFDVSFNELNGEIPDKGPFVNFTAEFFMGNKGLCGAPQFKVKECKMPRSSSKDKLLKNIFLAIAAVEVVVTLVLILLLRARKISPSLFDLSLGMHGRISYHEILHATGDFSEESLIGRGGCGSVYKANFSDGWVAAVKVFDLDVQGALKSFDTECRILRSIRHRNLVPVITCCSNLNFKSLVMEYMPNGSLEKWLYSTSNPLNIVERLGIMMDVAYAIEYLHESCIFPIVHCDLKPSNILLDYHMVAHVGDFGIAKLLTHEQRGRQTRTLGTIGYMAPEYGSEGLVSTKVDVYSYGILLMEIFSRRKPTDEMFSGELTMKRWISESFPNSVMRIVDRWLLNMDDGSDRRRHPSCLRSIIWLALECTADLPEERPNMKDVIERMWEIKLNLSNHNLEQQQVE